MVENIQVIKDVLDSIISISGRKTTQSHAIYLLETTVNNLKEQYSFLNNVNIQDPTYLEDGESVTIMGDVNNINSKDMGPAVKEIIIRLNDSLGTNAGHFFLKELSHKLNDESVKSLKDMGVDLDLMHLEQQVTKMESDILNKNSN